MSFYCSSTTRYSLVHYLLVSPECIILLSIDSLWLKQGNYYTVTNLWLLGLFGVQYSNNCGHTELLNSCKNHTSLWLMLMEYLVSIIGFMTYSCVVLNPSSRGKYCRCVLERGYAHAHTRTHARTLIYIVPLTLKCFKNTDSFYLIALL